MRSNINITALKALALGAGLAFWFAYYGWGVVDSQVPAMGLTSLVALVIFGERFKTAKEAK